MSISNRSFIGRVGFACVGYDLGWSTSHTFRLASFSESRLVGAVEQNLSDMQSLLEWMQPRGLRMLRIGSSFIPFASHAVMNVDWAARFGSDLAALGRKFSAAGFRFSMHPGQYTVLNSPNPAVVEQAVAELSYAATVLDLMALDASHKVLIHIGGVYGDKVQSTQRLLRVVDTLPAVVRGRLAFENDERHYNFAEVVAISETTGVPAIFDLHHDQLYSCGDRQQWLQRAVRVWDCTPKMHLSSQKPGARAGAHDVLIRCEDLRTLCDCLSFEVDLMIEAKGKEVAALEVLQWLGREVKPATRSKNRSKSAGAA